MTAMLRRTSPGTTPASPAPFNAPLFQELVSGLDMTERHVVLDLGAASTRLLALLGRARCRVEIADLAHFGGIERLNTADAKPALIETAGSLLPNRPVADGITLVFCWDLPNYLPLSALSALMTAIRDRSGPRALAHALFYYADPEMPQHPGRLVPTDDGELVDLSPAEATIAAPRYSPEAIGQHIGGFTIDRARLLGNGMQEYLFRLEP